MGLRFIQIDEVLYVEGTLDAKSIKNFRNQLDYLMHYCKSLVLNIDGLEFVDQIGIEALQDAYGLSIPPNKIFYSGGKKQTKYKVPLN